MMDEALAVVVVVVVVNAVSPVWGDPSSNSSMFLVVVVVDDLLLAPSRHEGCGTCAGIFLCNAAWSVVRSKGQRQRQRG
jgi:hypothetical protein